MTNDISVYSLAPATPVPRKDTVGSVREIQANSADQASPGESLDAAVGGAQQRPQKQELEDSVKDLNSLVQELHRELNFSVDEQSGEMVVKVVDRATDEVLRQIPAEDVLRLRDRLQQATGALFSDKV